MPRKHHNSRSVHDHSRCRFNLIFDISVFKFSTFTSDQSLDSGPHLTLLHPLPLFKIGTGSVPLLSPIIVSFSIWIIFSRFRHGTCLGSPLYFAAVWEALLQWAAQNSSAMPCRPDEEFAQEWLPIKSCQAQNYNSC